MMPVLFALPPDIVLLDVAGPAEAFRIANQKMPGSFELRFAGPSPAIHSGVGLPLGPLEKLPQTLAPGTLVVVPGVVGRSRDGSGTAALVEWLKNAFTSQCTLMCVCAGALLAAQAGLLRGRECTTHHSLLRDLARIDPDANIHDNRIFVEDANILSSAGITAGIDLALYLIGRRLGPQTAAEVARDMVMYVRRSGNDPALSPWLMHRNHMHPAVHRVQDAVTRNPAAPWSSSRMAEVAHTSARNLGRLFGEHAQCSPLDYLQRIRVALARELIVNGGGDIETVAEKSGFSSAHQLRRVWRKFETAPLHVLRAQRALD